VSDVSANNRIGIIAGGGQFPLLFIEAARRAGREIVLVAHRGETDETVAEAADFSCWVKLGQLGKTIEFFRAHQVAEAVFLGAITKTRIFRDILPDLTGLSLWNKIDTHQDDAILRAVAAELEKKGIRVLESTCYLSHLLFPQGILGRRKPNASQRADIEFGWRTARAVGALDIGQCVVVRDKAVMAVEAIEGTDAAIRRGGALARDMAVVVKLRKPGQDFRFDLPATGVATINAMREVGAAVLAVEAHQSLLFDAKEMISEADKAGIAVIGIVEREDGTLHY
jgi:DUF1009 family protein